MYIVNTTKNCIFCYRALAILLHKKMKYEVVQHNTPEQREAFKNQGHKSFPQIYRNGELIGGYDDLLIHFNL